MSEIAGDYKVGPGKPPLGSRFKKGQSGNPGGRRATTAPAVRVRTAPAVLVRTLHEEVVVAAKGRREKTTRREVVIVRLADKSAGGVLPVPKMLSEMLKDIDKKASLSMPPAETV